MERRGEGGDCRGELRAGRGVECVALRHGVHRNQLYAWRREQRSAVVADAGVPLPEFVPVIAQERVAAVGSAIEIEIGGIVLRTSPGVDFGFLGAVIRVLKATA